MAEGSKNGVEELASRLARYVRDLRDLDVRDLLEAQVLGHLLEGRRTIPELVYLIYDLDGKNTEYGSHYMKVRRSLQNLSSKGYVSCSLFGKNRPYRLTGYAIARLTHISRSRRVERLVPRSDLLLYGITTLLGIGSLLSGVDIGIEAWIYLAFAFLLGVCASCVGRTLRKVI